VAGWTAGALVLLVLALFEPVVDAVDERIRTGRARQSAQPPGTADAAPPGQRKPSDDADWSRWDGAEEAPSRTGEPADAVLTRGQAPGLHTGGWDSGGLR